MDGRSGQKQIKFFFRQVVLFKLFCSVQLSMDFTAIFLLPWMIKRSNIFNRLVLEGELKFLKGNDSSRLTCSLNKIGAILTLPSSRQSPIQKFTKKFMDLRTLVRTSIWMNFLVNIGDFSFMGSPINAKLKDSVKLGVLFMAQWAFC